MQLILNQLFNHTMQNKEVSSNKTAKNVNYNISTEEGKEYFGSLMDRLLEALGKLEQTKPIIVPANDKTSDMF